MIDLRMLCMDLKKPQSDLRQKSNVIIQDLHRILNDPTKRTKRIITEWKKEFKYIYGEVESNLSSNNKLDVKGILSRYGVNAGPSEESEQVQLLFYAIQTYFSILVKTILSEILKEEPVTGISPVDIILGKFALQKGIHNLCYPDWYSWPVFEMDNGFCPVMEEIQISVGKYRCPISLADFAKNNNFDYIKQIYEAVIPKELRHALGEYYTPDWLAEETLKTAASLGGGMKGQRFVDPTCGSGTFLFKTILEKRKNGDGLTEILRSVGGMDINPLAVLTAKTNYLLAIIDLIGGDTEIEIPVYNMDIIKYDKQVKDRELLDFLTCDRPEIEIIKYMEHDRKKAFLQEKADIIIGNPPWVNWEYMPEEYRINSQYLWLEYKLFSAKGRDLSFSKEDISVLITYIVLDKLLKDHGVLAFVIRQGVFKSAQNGVGFRRFRLKDECGIKVLRADDLSNIRVFDNASNSTALVYLMKGEENIYPVPYMLWEKKTDLKKLSFHAYSELQDVKGQISLVPQKAMPSVENDISSIWLTAAENDLYRMKKVLGKNSYKARTGVFTGGANGVYWLEINRVIDDKIEVTNISKKAKKKVKKVTKVIEMDYVFPMLRGSNVKKWNVTYDTYLLCPHTAETKMRPVAGEILRTEAPETYEYLNFFKDDLDERKGFAGWEKEIQREEFHAILRIGDYTFSRYKVIWKYIASEFVCAVIGCVDSPYLGNKLLLPNEKIMYVSTEDEAEAYYLCGILSSTLVAGCIKSYMNPTSISAHVLDKLNIPRFDPDNQDHVAIARACKAGHGTKKIDTYISEIDSIVERIYQ